MTIRRKPVHILNPGEKYVLRWLGAADYSQYGECCGKALDGLLDAGLAQIEDPGGGDGGFIAKGDDIMYRAVSLTAAGKELLNKIEDDEAYG